MCVCYLLCEIMVLIVGHASGDMVDDLGSGCGVVRRGLARAAIPLQTSHEATVSGKIDLTHKKPHTNHEWANTTENINFLSCYKSIITLSI